MLLIMQNHINMFLNLDQELKNIQRRALDYQDITQKYLISDQGREMNDAYKQKQNKNKIISCKMCHKKFLSFPALKEHSKKQHGFKPTTEGERKRGRPRRDNIKPSEQFHEWEKKENQQPQKPDRPSSLYTFPIDCQSIQHYKQNLLSTRLDVKDAINLLLDKDKNLLTAQLEEQYILRTLEKIKQTEGGEIKKFYLEKNKTILYLLTAYIINIAQIADEQFLKIMIILVKAIIFYIDHFARDDLIETIDIKDYGIIPPKGNRFHETMTIQTFPLVVNKFLIFLPSFMEEFPVIYASRFQRMW
ncbi:hypothetical protein pb186bvf_011539 [Paramecium bursaria]